jgi:hypothetical protein
MSQIVGPLCGLAFVFLFPIQAMAQGLADQQLELGAQAIAVVTRESPAIHGATLTEGYLTQPVLMADLGLWKNALHLKGTIDFEGTTLKRGELNAGMTGEGYADRRHPHTYLHELVATVQRQIGHASASLTAGKGFAPFGTDDPMSRPFEKYPINHHLSQILERAITVVAVQAKSIIVEGGLFNGDEPEGPGDTPNRRRYWDSWSGRVTANPFTQTELQASYARVKSPENAAGGGLDQRKQSASVRLEDPQQSGYALLEWARTADYAGAQQAFVHSTLLAETWAKYGAVNGALRFERTDRPDEERLLDPFRTSVPEPDLSVAGRSRWNILTARFATSLPGAIALDPFVEIARIRVRELIEPSGFDPRAFYGSTRMWSVSLGAKMSFGMTHMRMGRYGAAAARSAQMKKSGEAMPGMKMGGGSNAAAIGK